MRPCEASCGSCRRCSSWAASGRACVARGSFVAGLRAADHPEGALRLIRGLRGLIVWICLTCAALGVLLEQVWLLVFAGVWLLEEIYETGVLALILRSGGAEASGTAGAGRA